MKLQKLILRLKSPRALTLIALAIFAVTAMYSVHVIERMKGQLTVQVADGINHFPARVSANWALQKILGVTGPAKEFTPAEWRQKMVDLRDSKLNQEYKADLAKIPNSAEMLADIARAEAAIVADRPDAARKESAAWLVGVIQSADSKMFVAQSKASAAIMHALAMHLSFIMPALCIAAFLFGLSAGRTRRKPKAPVIDPDRARVAAAV